MSQGRGRQDLLSGKLKKLWEFCLTLPGWPAKMILTLNRVGVWSTVINISQTFSASVEHILNGSIHKSTVLEWTECALFAASFHDWKAVMGIPSKKLTLLSPLKREMRVTFTKSACFPSWQEARRLWFVPCPIRLTGFSMEAEAQQPTIAEYRPAPSSTREYKSCGGLNQHPPATCG